MVRIATSAPTRIDLAGGTLDIWPLYLFHRDAQTINVAISLRAHALIETRPDDRIVLHSVDTGVTVEADHWRALRDNRELRLLSLLAHFFEARGITLTTSSESPAGAGIAGSSALNVAVCAALSEWARTHYEPEALLQVAMNVEAQTIRVPTGLQDYRPALYGGLAALELNVVGVRRVPLDVELSDLESRLVLCYTGEPRNSGTNNWEIMKKHIDGDRHVFDCFERIRDNAVAMRAALGGGDWDGVGRTIAAEASCSGGIDPGYRRPHRSGHTRRRHRRQGLRRRRRGLSLLLRAARSTRRGAKCARGRRGPPPRLHHRTPRTDAWITARSREYLPK